MFRSEKLKESEIVIKNFNKNDDARHAWAACLKTAQKIPLHPNDYFHGLPDPFLHLPKNLLLFRRDAPMQGEAPLAHHRALLIFCLEGEGCVIVDDAARRLQPGHVLFVAPFQFHHYADFSADQMLWIYVSFEIEDTESLAALRGRTLPLSDFQITCLDELMSAYAASPSQRSLGVSLTLLAGLLVETLRSASAREARRNPSIRSLVHDVAAYVHQRASGLISVPEVARAVGISESHLRARFRQLAGLGVGAYIQRFRIHQARTMLHSPSLRLQTIAARCGYDSIQSFSRAFRREMGMSASEYRRSLKNL